MGAGASSMPSSQNVATALAETSPEQLKALVEGLSEKERERVRSAMQEEEEEPGPTTEGEEENPSPTKGESDVVEPSSFPFFQLGESNFVLDLSITDQRLCAWLYMSLMMKEGHSCMQDFVYTRADGTIDSLPMGIPRAWSVLEKLPEKGNFRGTYLSHPKDIDLEARRDLARSCKISDADTAAVTWPIPSVDVSGEDELRKALLKVHSKTTTNVSDAAKNAFRAMDPGREGSINLEKFQWGCRRIRYDSDLALVFDKISEGGRNISCREFEEWITGKD